MPGGPCRFWLPGAPPFGPSFPGPHPISKSPAGTSINCPEPEVTFWISTPSLHPVTSGRSSYSHIICLAQHKVKMQTLIQKLSILSFFKFFSFIFISWRLITLQYCSGFCHTLTHVFPIPVPPPTSLSTRLLWVKTFKTVVRALNQPQGSSAC